MPSSEKLDKLVRSIDELISRLDAFENRYEKLLERVDPKLHASAVNLVHYRALRSDDIRTLQEKLGHLGISRLAQSQSHVMASVLAARLILTHMAGGKIGLSRRPPVSIKKSSKLLRSHSKDLFGHRSKGRRTRIMVTLPASAARDYEFVSELVSAGMNSARINCAHDDPKVWGAMIENVRAAARAARKNVTVCMDLSGPKIRTGPMVPGPGVLRFGPDRDSLGRVSGPGLVWLGPPESAHKSGHHAHLPVDGDWLQSLGPGDRLLFKDTRDKDRFVEIAECEEEGCWAHAFDRSFVVAGTPLFLNGWDRKLRHVSEIPPTEESITLNSGDYLILHQSNTPGEPARYDNDGVVISEAHISCTNPDVFGHVGVGHHVLFDDGKIEGKVVASEPGEWLRIRIKHTKSKDQKLRADKGINFPDSSLEIAGLTGKDRQDLAFIVNHADVVNMSFVNTPSDVEDLLSELDRLDALNRIGIIVKVETQQAFDNLTEILLTAMRTSRVGVMIARGDLAVECGWRNIPRIQHEIQSLSRAAHLPDVWATQVLETMAKKGLPSRAELTDAASANGAECVMLNKGPYIRRTIAMLDSILKDMRPYSHDKAPMLPPLPQDDKSFGLEPPFRFESVQVNA